MFEPLPDQSAVYLQFNQVVDEPDQSLGEFVDRLRRFLDERQTANLIVDVRQNNGGNASLLTPLLSSPNFVGEETELLLPFSGVRGSVSSRYHQTDALYGRKLIAPQVPVTLSSADYFANRDPALDAVLRLITDDVQP